MKIDLLHTPEGVRDIYSDECARKLVIEDRMHKKIRQYGYRDIETPSFEFFDIFNKERGSVESKYMYKFFDRDNNTLVLRPDLTPSIARCAAKYYSDEQLPIKFCYNAKTFINNTSYQGRLKETTQIGAELIGDDSIYADAEILSMVADVLLDNGLKEFIIEISDVNYFKGLLIEAGIDHMAGELRDLIQEKNYFGVGELLKSSGVSDAQAKKIMSLTTLFGSGDVLCKARSLTDNETALKAIDRLEKIYELITKMGFAKYVTFDLGMLGNLDYYTGITFRAYTYGLGDPIVNGGRYDELLRQFGKDTYAIGFSITSEQFLLALERQHINVSIGKPDTMVLFDPEFFELAMGIVREHRMSGMNVNCIKRDTDKQMDNYLEYAKCNNIGGILYVGDTDNLTIIEVADGKQTSVKISEIMN